MQTTYYLDRKTQLLADLERAMRRARPTVVSLLGSGQVNEFYTAVLQEYAGLIPQLPYIGGKHNRLTTNLIQSAWCLAIYRVLQAHDIPLERVGEFLNSVYIVQLQAYPGWLLKLMGRHRKSFFGQRQLQHAALQSHLRRYPQDWLYDFIPGDGQHLLYGVDYHECGIVKFLGSQGASELGPYLCHLDFAISTLANLNFLRTQTIAEGADHCDFRIYRS